MNNNNETNNIIFAYCFLEVWSDILPIPFQGLKRNFIHKVVNRMKAYLHVVWERIHGIQIPSRITKQNIDNFSSKRKF